MSEYKITVLEESETMWKEYDWLEKSAGGDSVDLRIGCTTDPDDIDDETDFVISDLYVLDGEEEIDFATVMDSVGDKPVHLHSKTREVSDLLAYTDLERDDLHKNPDTYRVCEENKMIEDVEESLQDRYENFTGLGFKARPSSYKLVEEIVDCLEEKVEEGNGKTVIGPTPHQRLHRPRLRPLHDP